MTASLNTDATLRVELVECQFGVLFAREQQQPSEGASTEESSAA